MIQKIGLKIHSVTRYKKRESVMKTDFSKVLTGDKCHVKMCSRKMGYIDSDGIIVEVMGDKDVLVDLISPKICTIFAQTDVTMKNNVNKQEQLEKIVEHLTHITCMLYEDTRVKLSLSRKLLYENTFDNLKDLITDLNQ